MKNLLPSSISALSFKPFYNYVSSEINSSKFLFDVRKSKSLFVLFLMVLFSLNSTPLRAQLDTDLGGSYIYKVELTDAGVKFQLIHGYVHDGWEGFYWSKLTVNGTLLFEGTNYLNDHGHHFDYENSKSYGGATFTDILYGAGFSSEDFYTEVTVPHSYFTSGVKNTVKFWGDWDDWGNGSTGIRTSEGYVLYEKPEKPSEPRSDIDENGVVTLHFANPSNIDKIFVKRGGTTKTISGGATSWEDPNININSESYYISVSSIVDGVSFTSGSVSHTPDLPPKPDVPVNVTATEDACNGKTTLTWDYDGDVTATGFKIKYGSTYTSKLAGDIREYEFSIGNHSSKTFSVMAYGPVSTRYSDYSSSTSGTTYGSPTVPGNFRATAGSSTITLNWNASSHCDNYILKRSSSGGSTEVEISSSETSYIDNTVNSCEQYTYQLFASNSCTYNDGITGIKATNDVVEKITPPLNSYILSIDASKAYFPNKVTVDWSVTADNINLVDLFEIYRSIAGTGNYELIATVSGESSYEDQSATGGIMYEYKVRGKLDCEGDIEYSNMLTTSGFRIPYGIVNGHIEYESGVAVKGAEVLAEKSSGSVVGTSLLFDGSSFVQIANNEKLNPNEFLATEAWVKPTSISGTHNIIKKHDGSNGYSLYQQDNDIFFKIKVNGSVKTVYALDVLESNTYTHVAGVKDETGVKIYINGKIPVNVTYIITSESVSGLETMGISQDVITDLSTLQDIEYSTFEEFNTAVESEIGLAQTQRNMPLILPLTKKEEYKYGSIVDATGIITNTNTPLILGDNFNGFIDEVRLWNNNKTSEDIFFDYKRIMGNDAFGIAGYWRFDENFGTTVYDASKSMGEYHKNNGNFVGNIDFDTNIPNSSLLGWVGVTNTDGDYTIPYVPYFGTGENFSITPRFGQHQFKPGSATVFLGEGAAILNGQDFTDISSFKLTGTVFYENTTCGVEATIITVDGEPVIKDGNVIMTNANGEFEISVPVGNHYVSVMKNGHVYKSFKFPPGETTNKFDFQEDIIGINFIDTTRMRIVGRVVGGTIQGDMKPGLGLSKNNIGKASFKFESVTGPNCSVYEIETDSLTGEYTVELPPMKYYVRDMDVASNPMIHQYFTDLEVADFSRVKQEEESSHTFTGLVNAEFTIHKTEKICYIDVDGVEEVVEINPIEIISEGKIARIIYNNDIYEFVLDTENNITKVIKLIQGNGETVSTTYNYRLDYIYRSVPEIRVTASDGVSNFTGETILSYEDPKSHTTKNVDISGTSFNYPIFKQNKVYTLLLFAEEIYHNNDICDGINGCDEAIIDLVNVDDGQLIISNQLANERSPAPITLADGKATYSFKAGAPNVLKNVNYPWRSFSSVLNINIAFDDLGKEWIPIKNKSELSFNYPLAELHNDDKYFRGYVLGSNNIEGGEFVTNGPNVVDMILRDPPGDGSYAYISKGSTFSFEQSLSTSNELTESLDVEIHLGCKFSTGIGFSTETETLNNINVGFSATQKWENQNTITNEVTVTDTWQTSDGPDTGAQSDLFFGSSKNFIVSLADNLTIRPVDFIAESGIESAGKEANGLKICLNQVIMAAPDGSDTHFIYTVDHIENTLIPNLINIRNSLFRNDSRYTSKLAITSDKYGTNNDDSIWGTEATTDDPVGTDYTKDYDGPSYTYAPVAFDEIDGNSIPKNPDEIRKCNQQIRLWEEALERNEMEKVHSKTIKNISFDSGPYFEHSTETSITQSHSYTFEASYNPSAGIQFGAKLGGLGVKTNIGISYNYSNGKTSTSTTTKSNTFGYMLHDESSGDYFSVDVKDAGTGTGPVFIVMGGKSMCPNEKKPEINYYTPAKYEITDEVYSDLVSKGMNSDLLKILNISEELGSYSYIFGMVSGTIKTSSKISYQTLKNNYPVNPELDEFLDDEVGDKVFELEQVKNRKFSNKLDLVTTVEDLINLKLDLTLEQHEEYADDFNDRLEDLGTGEISDELMTDADNNLSYIYLISKENRAKLLEEWARFRSYIYDESEFDVDSKEINLGTSTVRREVPIASITPALVTDVPDDNKAYFSIELGNGSYTNDDMFYSLKVIDDSNPDGAIILMDGVPVDRGFAIKAGESIVKTISVEMGKPDVYEYDDIEIVLFSSCEAADADFHFDQLDDEAYDIVTFSAHFIPSCSDIDIVRPDDMFVINNEDEKLVDGQLITKVPVILSGYDLNNSILDKIAFQYKTLAEPDWTTTKPFFITPPTDDDNEVPGAFTGLEWDLSGFPDGQYQMRAKTYCGTSPEGTPIFDLSEIWTGTVDRKAPQVFGSPQPADGILSPDDDITIEFNEVIFAEKLTKLENFDIRGILNGTEIRHDVSVRYNNDTDHYIRIPDGINLSGKSFTVEFWLKPDRSNYAECIFSQSTNPSDAIYVGTNNSGYFELQIGNETLEFTEVSVSDVINAWHHYAFVYDNVRNEALMFMDGVAVGNKTININYQGYGDIYIGKSLLPNNNPLQGNIHELRIWERPRTASKLVSNMLISLSGKETGLIGYWPFDDADGTLAVDKVHKRNATVKAKWDISPSGYAASFTGSEQGIIDMSFSNIAFSQEQDFTMEFWFKGSNGANQCFVSNGHGDENDVTIYYISPESLEKIVKVMPLEEDVELNLSPMMNVLFGDEETFMTEVGTYITPEKAEQYKEQILRFAKVPPTYWSINTDANGNLQVNNNGKRIKVSENYFDNQWHHLALIVERVGNTRVFVDGELKISEPSTEWSGFGGARLFIGARGLFNPDIAGFQYDQYFTGTMDEIRVWNTALKQTQIQRNNKMRLDGDELGLVAYLPFESYEEVMGIPVIGGLLKDNQSDREVLTNSGVFTQNTDVPNVRMKRPSSKVDFSIVAKEDRVAFVINEPTAKIENCILDITTKNVQDMYGNKMTSPVTWSAYVDINQVKWETGLVNLEKRMYESMSFSTTINNNSGKQQNFSIENIPSWLTAEPRSGTLNPLTSQEIVFTVASGVNIGRYSRDIHLQTDFDFDEKLLVNLHVFTDLPSDWEVNPNDYEHSMNVVGMLKVNNVISTDKYDKVGAFVNGECRGIANLKYIKEYDMYEVFLDVYSSKVSNEYFEIHVWDASTGREFRKVTADLLVAGTAEKEGLYEFIDNSIYGMPSHPVMLEANNTIIQKIPLFAGWNWKSFNLEMDKSKPLTNLLEGITPHEGDMVKGLISYSDYGTYWIGTLNYLEPEQMYMFKLKNADTLKVSGIPVTTSETPIEVVKGWSWIGYTPQVNISINEAFGMFNANHGDVVKSQFAFSMYDELMGWVGTLTYLQPNQGYKYLYIPQGDAETTQNLIYPEVGSMATAKKQAEVAVTKLPNWSDYQYNMPLVVVINGASKQDFDDEIYAYEGDKLVGIATPVVSYNEQLLYFVTIYGNKINNTIKFEYKNSKGELFSVSETVEFVPSDILGTIDSPYSLTVPTESNSLISDVVECNIYPNPFKNEFKIEVLLPESSNVTIEIANTSGVIIETIKSKYGETYNAMVDFSNYSSGVYLAIIDVNGVKYYKKIIKK